MSCMYSTRKKLYVPLQRNNVKNSGLDVLLPAFYQHISVQDNTVDAQILLNG